MAINSINPWGGLNWMPGNVSHCLGPNESFGAGCCPPHTDQLRFAMMRQLQWMESMLERLASMLGGGQPGQPMLPCFGPTPGPVAPAPCFGGPTFSTPATPPSPAPPAGPPPTPATPAPGATAPGSATGPGGSGMKAGAPAGYHTIKGSVPPGVTAKAKSLLNQPMGSEHSFEMDGKRYLARLEHHYHPPGYQGGPNGWHKGVSVYEAN